VNLLPAVTFSQVTGTYALQGTTGLAVPRATGPPGIPTLSGAIALPMGGVTARLARPSPVANRASTPGYSAAMASSMLTRAARRAGMVPAISPVAAPTTT
jgi:hypothetical protein